MRMLTGLISTPPTIGLALATLVLAAPVTAQDDDTVRLVGHVVTDRDQAPIERVVVTVVDPDGNDLTESYTDAEGRFTLLVDENPGTVKLRAQRLGYATVLSPPLHIEGFTTMTVEVRLSPEAVPMAPLEVVSGRQKPTSFKLDGFQRRRELGLGSYITRDDIERRNPSHVSDLLRTLPGIQLSSSGTGSNAVVTMDRGVNLRGRCAAQIYVDEFHVNRAGGWTFRIDDVVSPGDVFGIEVYRGLATVPAEFLSPQADCGVVVIWTRRMNG